MTTRGSTDSSGPWGRACTPAAFPAARRPVVRPSDMLGPVDLVQLQAAVTALGLAIDCLSMLRSDLAALLDRPSSANGR
jgi:hypothetical protein